MINNIIPCNFCFDACQIGTCQLGLGMTGQSGYDMWEQGNDLQTMEDDLDMLEDMI